MLWMLSVYTNQRIHVIVMSQLFRFIDWALFSDCELGDLKDVTEDLKEDRMTQTGASPQASSQNQASFPNQIQVHVECSPLNAGRRLNPRMWSVCCFMSLPFSPLKSSLATTPKRLEEKKQRKTKIMFRVAGVSHAYTLIALR